MNYLLLWLKCAESMLRFTVVMLESTLPFAMHTNLDHRYRCALADTIADTIRLQSRIANLATMLPAILPKPEP